MTASRACNYLQNAAATTYKKFLQFYAKRSCKKQLHHGRMIYNRKGTHLTVLPEKEWLSANTMQEGTRLFGILPFLLYTVLQVALFVFRISLFHSDRLSGHRLHIFHRAPAFLPVSLRFSDVSGHNPVVVLSIVFYLDIPLS